MSSGGAWLNTPLNSPDQSKDKTEPQTKNEEYLPELPDTDNSPVDSNNHLPELPSGKNTRYEELDSQLLKQHSLNILDGINLTPLLKFIHPDVSQKEPDTVWTIDSLFNDLKENQLDNKNNN